MRTLVRHAIALLLFTFLVKIAVQAQEPENGVPTSGVPKSLLLGSLPPRQAIPSTRIDTRRIVAAIRKE